MKIWNWGMFSLHLNTEIAALKKKKKKNKKTKLIVSICGYFSDSVGTASDSP